MNELGVAWLPGLVFLALSVWLVRKAIKAARTERDLEEDRLAAALKATDLAPSLAAALEPTDAKPRLAVVGGGGGPSFPGRDAERCNPEHLALIKELLAARPQVGAGVGAVAGGVDVVWARSAGDFAVWCERGHQEPATGAPAREILCVVQIRSGRIVNRWTYGAA
jgi:hypothetical protein